MSIELPEFTPAQESLFLTLGSRALDSRLPRPFLGDTMADEISQRIGPEPTNPPTEHETPRPTFQGVRRRGADQDP